MKTLIVVVNYRVADLTIDCLRSIAAELATAPDTHVRVFENGTGDDSAARIQRAIDENAWGSWCSLTASPVNLGFTGGNNAIIRPVLNSAHPPDYVLLLNPDTIVRPGAFNALVDFMDANPGVGIAGSRLEDPDGTPQRSAFRFQTPLGVFEAGLRLGLASRLLNRWIIAPPVVDHSTQADWVPAASMIVRRTVDEGLFTYYDDIDLCHRRRQKAGQPGTCQVATSFISWVNLVASIAARQNACLPTYWTRVAGTF